MKKGHKKKYVSVKLPACGDAYPLDENGCKKLPKYTTDYLEKHGRKLFKILLEQVPFKVYTELLKHIRKTEKI